MTTLSRASTLLALLLPVASAAQLTITSSPNPAVVEVGSILSFSAYVPTPSSKEGKYALRCSEPQTGCGYAASYPKSITAMGSMQKLAFTSYTVPSTVDVGMSLCFEVYIPGKSYQNPYGGVIEWTPAKVIASACKKVSIPHITAREGATAGSAAITTAVVPPPTAPRNRMVSSTGARTTSTARSSIGSLPDLVITLEKSPVAKWIVRNIGTAHAPETYVEFRRLGLSGSASRFVGALAAGASAEIVVTPDLDAYLVNSTVDVDPSDKIKEVTETNNRWTSADHR